MALDNVVVWRLMFQWPFVLGPSDWSLGKFSVALTWTHIGRAAVDPALR